MDTNNKKEQKKIDRLSDSGTRDDDDDGAILDTPEVNDKDTYTRKKTTENDSAKYKQPKK